MKILVRALLAMPAMAVLGLAQQKVPFDPTFERHFETNREKMGHFVG